MVDARGRRRDAKHRILYRGESVRADGKYQFKYHVNGKPHFLYSWRLEPTDPLPAGKKPCLSLREQEKRLNRMLDQDMDPEGRNITVMELVERYLETRTGVKHSTLTGYNFVRNLLAKQVFSGRKICNIRTSDAKLFLIKLQQEGRGSSTIKTVRGVLRPAFQMAVEDELLNKNPFGFELAGVIVNDSVTREAISRDQMRKFLRFIHESHAYCKYYEVVYILFHTGLRISEFCGLTVRDLDLEHGVLNVERQLQRTTHMQYVVTTTKTRAGKRKLPLSEDVIRCFRAILEDRGSPTVERMVDGLTGFLFLDKKGMPLVAMHWEHRFKNMREAYNRLYREQLPDITPHVCRHTYCSNMAHAGMNPKTLQYLMGHSEIGVTMNTYTHLGLDDATEELARLREMEAARQEQSRMNGGKRAANKVIG